MAFAGEWDVLGEPNNKVVGPCGVLAGGENARKVISPSMIAGLGLWYSASDPRYDAFTYEQALPTLFDASGNGWDATQGTGSNQARFLTHDGRNYLRSPGISGNYASTPNTASYNGLTQLDIVWCGSMNNWSALNQNFVSKWRSTGGNERSLGYGTNTGTPLRPSLFISGDGVNTGGALADVDLPASNNDIIWQRCTWRASDQRTQFFYSTESPATPPALVVWTQLGTNRTATGSIASLFNSAEPLTLGGRADGGGLLAGRTYYAHFCSTIDGSPIAIFDPSRGNFNSATIGSATGETWTINRTGLNPAMIVSARAFLPLTDDFYDISASAADVLRNVSGGTMVAARGVNSSASPHAFMQLSTAVDPTLSRMTIRTFGATFSTGGRRLDADTFVGNNVAGHTAYNFAVQAARLNYSAALSVNFVNGLLVGSQLAFQTSGNSEDTASAAMRVFSNSGVSSDFQSGPVTDLCLYNRAVPNAQIRSLSRYFAGRTGGAITV